MVQHRFDFRGYSVTQTHMHTHAHVSHTILVPNGVTYLLKIVTKIYAYLSPTVVLAA